MISAFGVDHGDFSKAREDRPARDYAIGAGAGVAGGALAMPVRIENNSRRNPFRDAPSGTTRADLSDISRIARKPGSRKQGTAYTARMAQTIKDGKAPKSFSDPVDIHTWSDGSSRQMNGSHRIWAKTMAGEKDVPVRITRVEGSRPTVSGAERLATAIGDKRQRLRLRGGAWSPNEISETASLLRPESVDTNTARGGRTMVGGSERVHRLSTGPTKRALQGKQAAFVAGGAAAGVGAVHLARKGKNRGSA
jgi:hypothetical protein